MLNQNSRLYKGGEDFPVQQFITKFAVERFDIAILPRAARLDKERFYANTLQPIPHSFCRELRAVI